MKTYTERKLEQIQRIAEEKKISLSCDIYYDNLRVDRKQQFVAKIIYQNRTTKYFRTDSIRKSLRLAVDYAERL